MIIDFTKFDKISKDGNVSYYSKKDETEYNRIISIKNSNDIRYDIYCIKTKRHIIILEGEALNYSFTW